MDSSIIEKAAPGSKSPNFAIRWLNRLEQNSSRTYWLSYVALFLIMFLLMDLFLLANNETFIWLGDGLPQQYTSFVQLGDIYREMASGIASGEIVIPMFSPALGYGNDVLLSLSSYFSNPLFLIAAFATPENADVVLCSTVIVTLFLSGVFFTLFARSHSDNGFAILIGCLVYVFSGFTLTAFSQIHMIYPLMMGPLIFLGAELVFQRRSPVLFPIAMALLMANAIDMAYDCCILLFFYCIIRFFSLPEKPSVRSFFVWFAKFAGLLVLAACISAVFFLPCAYDLLNQDRVGLERTTDLIYPVSYYYRLLTGFISFAYIGSESFYGFFPIAFIAILILLVSKKCKQRTVLLSLFIILTIILLFPILGKVMNGFAYPNNRWSWIYSLLVGYITVIAIPIIFELPSKKRNCALILSSVYIVLGLGISAIRLDPAFLCAIIILAILTASVFLLRKRADVLKLLLLGSVVVSCGTTYWLWGAFSDPTRMLDHTEPGESYSLMVSDSANSLMKEIEGTDWRYDAVSAGILRNSPLAVGKNGVTFYNSFYNNAIDDMNSELGLTSAAYNISLSNLDCRLILYNLGGIRYLLTTGGIADNAAGDAAQRSIPIGYDDIVLSKKVGDNEYAVLETDFLLPLAFSYEHSCSQESIGDLTPIQKQDVMALDAILDNRTGAEGADADDSKSNPTGAPGFSSYSELDELCQNIPYTVKLMYPNGEESRFALGQEFIVPAGGADLRISADIQHGKRAFLQMEKIQWHENDSAMKVTSSESSFNVKVASGTFETTIMQTLPAFSLYSGKDTWAANLGIAQSDRSEIVVHFSTPGTYSIDELAVTLEDEETVLDKLEELGQNAADDIAFKGNTLTCSKTVPESTDGGSSEFLFVRLPYSEGWHATVNDEEADIIKANYGFMAIELGAGEHEITFSYETPYLKVGAILSCIGIAALIILAIAYRRCRKAA